HLCQRGNPGLGERAGVCAEQERLDCDLADARRHAGRSFSDSCSGNPGGGAAPATYYGMEFHGRRVDEMASEGGTIATMRERELAERIEAMRDDPDAWGDPVAEPERKRKSERRQRAAMVSVRFAPDELTSVQEHAAE